MLEVASLLADFAQVITPGRSNGGAPGFFGYRECESVSTDDVSLFSRTFNRRGTALLEGFDQWQASRRNFRGNSTNSRRVGIGVYLIADEDQAIHLPESTRRKSSRR
jgi:hypothetical protein